MSPEFDPVDFVPPLTPAQIDQLRPRVQTVTCGTCGTPVDLARDSVRAHDGSPVAIVDPAPPR